MGFELTILQGVICCVAFFFAGLIDSITGGGGLITIPVMLAVGIPVHYITGTNQCAAWAGTGVASYKFIKSGNIHFKSALATLPFAVFGSYLGARLNLLVPDQSLKIFMIAAIPVIAIFVFFKKEFGEQDHADEQTTLRVLFCSAVIGIVLGLYLGFYGPGAGVFFMLAYTALLKLNLVRATGNTRFIITIAFIGSIITYAASGAVIWKLVIACTIFNIVGSYIGASIAIKKGARIIRPVMLGVLALLIIKVIIDLR